MESDKRVFEISFKENDRGGTDIEYSQENCSYFDMIALLEIGKTIIMKNASKGDTQWMS